MKSPAMMFQILLIGALVTGCFGKNQPETLGEIQNEAPADVKNGFPYVEAYIEYTGPQKRWAGPATFILHVVARDSGDAKIWVTPPMFTEEYLDANPKARALASESKRSSSMTTEVARRELVRLAGALSKEKVKDFQGCMYPVRVWLINANGSIAEKKGCRGTGGWVKTTSQIVDGFLTAALNPQFGIEKPAPKKAVQAKSN